MIEFSTPRLTEKGISTVQMDVHKFAGGDSTIQSLEKCGFAPSEAQPFYISLSANNMDGSFIRTPGRVEGVYLKETGKLKIDDDYSDCKEIIFITTLFTEKDYEKCGVATKVLELLPELINAEMNAKIDAVFKFTFPVLKQNSSTRLDLKTPKTESSQRRVWIPETICKLLLVLKEQQERYKKMYGDKYEDYDLVITNSNGRPVESNRILEMLQELLEECDLPEVDFHSLRHTSTTFKLIITNGDIKSVQGDNGQAVAAMVTDTYSFILDSNRKNTANLFEREFFGNESENSNTDLTEKQMEIFVSHLSANPDMFQKFTAMLTQKAVAFS